MLTQTHRILQALSHSLHLVDENIRWRRYRFDKAKLSRQLKAIGSGKIPESLIQMLSDRYGVSVLRMDSLSFGFHGFEKKFDRQMVAESLGAIGVQFFPTRQSATRSAQEAARELAFFGYGDFDNQFMTCPIAQILSYLHPDAQIPRTGTILRDIRDEFSSDESVFDIFKNDPYFKANIRSNDELLTFQSNLRMNPLSGLARDKCEDFFNRHVTIGVRDTVRWMLGARHPSFDWDHAKTLIEKAFEHHGKNHFNTPQIVYYAYDPNLDDVEIEAMIAHNANVTKAFAESLKKELLRRSPNTLNSIINNLEKISAWILDIHHDYPDFDLEAKGHLGASTQIDFLGHSIQNKVSSDILGNTPETRRNINIQAHFEARGFDRVLLGTLSSDQLDAFYGTVEEMLNSYDANNGILSEQTPIMYQRIPCFLFVIQDLGEPELMKGEKLLDTFTLSQITELEHASYIRTFPELSEQLVVFFMLTLHHMLETEHVPDLQPKDFTKDYLMLGLWGTRTPKLRLNLYVDSSVDERDLADHLKRSELRFVGTEQIETSPLNHIREDAKAIRVAISHIAPSAEASILRNIGTFTMAMDEFDSISKPFKLDAVTTAHYILDTAREVARWGVKGSVTDFMTVFEYMLDSSYNNVQKGLDILSKKLKKK